MNRKLFLSFLTLLFLVGTVNFISAEKMWNFNNHTVNVSNNILSGAFINATTDLCLTNGLCLTNLNSTLGSNYIPYTGSNKNVVLGAYNLTADTNTFFIDSSSNRIGIGTLSPNELLEINSSMRFTNPNSGHTSRISIASMPSPAGGLSAAAGLVADYGAVNQSLILQNGYSGDMGGIKITDDGVAIWGAGDEDLFRAIDEDSNVIRFKINDVGAAIFTNDINVDSGTFFVNSSSNLVGIGTTSPTGGKLNVIGSANVTGLLTFGSLAANSLNNTYFAANSVNARVIASSAINTTHILDGTILAGDIAANAINSTHIATGAIINADILANAINTTQIIDGTILAGDIAASAINTTHILDGTILETDIAQTSSLDNTEIADIYLFNTGDTATGNYTFDTNTLFIDSSANNVGIGTISPKIKTEIRGASNGLPATSGTNQINASMRIGNVITGGVLDIGEFTGDAWLQATHEGDLSQTYDILLNPNGGNVGIGTTSPSAALDVRAVNTLTHSFGNLLVTSTDTAAIDKGGQLSFGGGWSGTSTTYFASIAGRKENALAANLDGYLQFATRDNTTTLNREKMRITSTGNVGIGTTSPEFKLSLDNDGGIIAKGTFGSGANLLTSGEGAKLIWYPKYAAFRAGYAYGAEWDDANIGHMSTATGFNTTATAVYSTAMGSSTTASGEYSTAMGAYTTSSGFVSTAMGISTTSSGYASTAMGESTTSSGWYTTATGYGTIASGNTSTAMGRAINVGGANSFGIGLNSTAYTLNQANTMAIMGGNVGIGTTSPTQKLDVNGNINISGGGDLIISPAGGTGNDIQLYNDFGDLYTITGGSERMRITSGGNVGINAVPTSGAGADTSKLLINSDLGTTSNSALNAYYGGSRTGALGEVALLAHRTPGWSQLYLSGDGSSTNYALYSAGTKPSYLGGDLSVGSAVNAYTIEDTVADYIGIAYGYPVNNDFTVYKPITGILRTYATSSDYGCTTLLYQRFNGAYYLVAQLSTNGNSYTYGAPVSLNPGNYRITYGNGGTDCSPTYKPAFIMTGVYGSATAGTDGGDIWAGA